MSCKVYIYSLDEPKTGEPRYVGKTVNPGKRLYGHIRYSEKNNKTYKDCWIRKLCREGSAPVLTIVDEVENSSSNFWEQHYISLYKSWGFKLTNLTDGGDGGNTMLGVKQSIETIKKRNQARRNNGKPWISEECKIKMRENASGNQNMKNKHHSEESKRQMSQSHKEIVTDEFKERMRIINLGNQNRKGKKCPKEIIKKLSKPVLQLDLQDNVINRYISYSEALRSTKIKGIANCLRGNTKTSGGYKWIYDTV